MIKRLKFLSTLCCLSLLLTGCSSSTDKEDKSIELNISAAASLKEAMADLEAAYTSKNPEVSKLWFFWIPSTTNRTRCTL